MSLVLEVVDPSIDVACVLVVSAHPDDVDFGAAGTVSILCQKGVEVHYCIVTDGEAGGENTSVTPEELVKVRRFEQSQAADILGVKSVSFLGYPDGSLEVTHKLRCDISEVIRRVRPDRVIAPSPMRNWTMIHASHPDHLAAGEAAVDAIYPDARNPFAHRKLLEQGLEPHVVPQLWLMASPIPQIAVDITEVFEAKLNALWCHESQIPPGERDSIANRLKENFSNVAKHAGLSGGKFAEAFQAVDTR